MLERIPSSKSFEQALRQCHEVMKTFEGSEETLKHIRRVEESLRNVIRQMEIA